MEIQLSSKDMNSDREPRRSTEADVEASGSLVHTPSSIGAESIDEDMVVRITPRAGRMEGFHDGLVPVQHEGDLGAGVGDEVLVRGEGYQDFVGGYADDAHGYDEAALLGISIQGEMGGMGYGGTHANPSANHPRAVLLDLQSFDIIISDADTAKEDDECHAEGDLNAHAAAKAMLCYHEDAGHAGERADDDQVAVDAVEEDDFVADDGDELEEGEETGWEDGAEVKEDADAAASILVVEAFAGQSIGFVLVCWAEDAVEVEVHESGEGEAQECAGGYHP